MNSWYLLAKWSLAMLAIRGLGTAMSPYMTGSAAAALARARSVST